MKVPIHFRINQRTLVNGSRDGITASENVFGRYVRLVVVLSYRMLLVATDLYCNAVVDIACEPQSNHNRKLHLTLFSLVV